MIKIILLCGAGMSTGVMAKKMQKAGEARGMELSVTARAYTDADFMEEGTDMFLLGPQISYYLERLKQSVTDRPVAVINMADYGMMNGEKVLNDALKEIEEWKQR